MKYIVKLKYNFIIVDETKFFLIYIFKGKRLKREEQILFGIFVWFQSNGQMDTDLMKQYVDYLNEVRTNNEFKDLIIIVYNSFKKHLEKTVKEKF